MDPVSDLERTALGLPHHQVDEPLAAELGLAELLHTLTGKLDEHEPMEQRIWLSALNAGPGNFRGNPVDWPGFLAGSIAVWNPNTFGLYVGGRAGAGNSAERRVVVPARSLAVLPIQAEVYSVGCDAANVASADADVYLARYKGALPPFLAEFGTIPAGIFGDPLFADVMGTSASGAADDGSNPVKIGGRYNLTQPILADGNRGDLQLDSRGSVRVALTTTSGGAIQALTTEADNQANTTALIVVGDAYGYNGATWDRLRAVTKLVDIPPTAVTAGTPVSIWTPAAGKKFRILGWALSLSVAGSVILLDNAAGAFVPGGRTPLMAAGVGLVSPVMGNGFLSAAANNALKADVSASGTIQGYVYGTEE